MSASILVAYATRNGSTEEVAEAITSMLHKHGFDVDIEPVRLVHDPGKYRAIVLGAPLYMFHWHKDALHFLQRHQNILKTRPVAIFALGPFHAEEEEFQLARQQIEKELAQFPWLKPQSLAIFGGSFNPQKLTFPYNFVPLLRDMPASDVRDWAAICSWADDLVPQFRLALDEIHGSTEIAASKEVV